MEKEHPCEFFEQCSHVRKIIFVRFFFLWAINSIREATSTRNITLFFLFLISLSIHIFLLFLHLVTFPYSIFPICCSNYHRNSRSAKQLRTIFHDNSFIIDCFWFFFFGYHQTKWNSKICEIELKLATI